MTLQYAHLAPGHKVQGIALLAAGMDQKPAVQKLDKPTNCIALEQGM